MWINSAYGRLWNRAWIFMRMLLFDIAIIIEFDWHSFFNPVSFCIVILQSTHYKAEKEDFYAFEIFSPTNIILPELY